MARRYKIKDARATGARLGRAGLADLAIKAVSDFDGSYKGAMKLCGKLAVLADCATFDIYWEEIVDRGTCEMVSNLQGLVEPKAGE